MAILQAIFALLSRSLGKVVTAIFGWAVVALFGQTTDKEKTLLSALVGAAVLWPFLLVGIAVPRAAALLIAFVPMHASVPDGVMRVIWIGLSFIIPAVMGVVMATKAPPATAHDSVPKRILRGWPITIALSAGFLITFVTVPILRVMSIIRRRVGVNLPAVTDARGYHQVAAQVVETLVAHGFALERAPAPLHVTLPSKVLLKLGGRAFRGFIPDDLEFYRAGTLTVTFYPSGLQLSGLARETARAHAVVDERLTSTPAVQTTAPQAQAIEQQIRRVWSILDENREAHVGSRLLLSRLDDIAAEARKLDVSFMDWQVIYRQLLQLDRALRGQPQLIEKVDAELERAGQMPDGLVAKAAWVARRVVEP
jgi:hypothetical protein